VRIENERLAVEIHLTTANREAGPQVERDAREVLSKLAGVRQLDLKVTVETPGQAAAAPQVLPGVRYKVAVASGKGGVGKSTVAANLALALKQLNLDVGLLDADLYGPSIPQLLGIHQQPRFSNGRIEPLEVDGLNVMSIGLLIPRQEAVIWRGPMLHSALRQLLGDTDWGELDYLIVDLPPGTGDVAISLSQLVPTAAAVVVCTPQDVALLDATRAITMFRRMNMEILGMVENMSFFICTNCNARHEVFGCGGAKRRAAELGVAFLGELPLVTQLRVLGDEGRLTEAFGLPGVKEYLEELCRQLVREIADRRRRNPHMPTLPIVDRPFPRQSET